MKRGMEPRNLMKKEWAERISHIKKALAYAEKALHVSPGDKAIQYNIAMITQKPAELLLNAQIQPHQRELNTLQWAIDCAHTAQKCVSFARPSTRVADSVRVQTLRCPLRG